MVISCGSPNPKLDIVFTLYKPGALEFRLMLDLSRLTRTPHAFHYVDNSDNKRNMSTAWNECAERGSAPYICFIHTDIVLSKGWEQPLLEYLEFTPEAGAVLPNPARFDLIGRKFNLSTPPTEAEMDAWASWAREAQDSQHTTFAVPAGDCACFFAVMVRRKDFQALCGFDERVRFWGNNNEFQLRLDARKLHTMMVHASSVWHQEGTAVAAAEKSGAFDGNVESAQWKLCQDRLRANPSLEWHKLSPAKRAAVRSDPRYLIGKSPFFS